MDLLIGFAVNFLAFYSSSIFRGPSCDASPTSAPLWYTWGFGLTNFLFAWPAVFAIDTFGRRALPLFSTATSKRREAALRSRTLIGCSVRHCVDSRILCRQYCTVHSILVAIYSVLFCWDGPDSVCILGRSIQAFTPRDRDECCRCGKSLMICQSCMADEGFRLTTSGLLCYP